MTDSRSQPTSDSAPTSFDITWRNGAYYVSVPNYQGGTVYTSEYVAALVKALEAVEFRGHQGKCPLCAGWNMSPSGETPGKHTKDCLIAAALSHRSAKT